MTLTYFCQWVGGKNSTKHLLFFFKTPKLNVFKSRARGLEFILLTLPPQPAPSMCQAPREVPGGTVMTRLSPPLTAKPVDVTDKNT